MINGKVAIVEIDGTYAEDMPPECWENPEESGFIDWTRDHPGDLPGESAVYRNSQRLPTGEHVNGTWDYAPYIPPVVVEPEPTLAELQAKMAALQAQLDALAAKENP